MIPRHRYTHYLHFPCANHQIRKRFMRAMEKQGYTIETTYRAEGGGKEVVVAFNRHKPRNEGDIARAYLANKKEADTFYEILKIYGLQKPK